MYEAYYGFSEKPFALSPDPKYLFLSQTHREVLGHLVYGIEEGEGFMAISGEVGTGKTTLCRTLLERLGSGCEIAFLFNPTLGPTDLIKAINGEFGLSTFGDSRAELIDVLNSFLLEQREQGRRVLVIIDEAQTLPTETLEQLRLLGNLESQTAKLLQILLIGQPELDERLEARNLRQLRQRISVWWRLEALGPAETKEYVRHRLRLASDSTREYFSDAALTQIHRSSGGVPRLINVLADRSLLAAYGENQPHVTAAMVRNVANELRARAGQRFPRWPGWLAGAAGVLGAAALVWGFASSDRPTASPATPPVAAAPSPAPVPDAPEAPEGPAPPPPPLEVAGEGLDAVLATISADASRSRALDALLASWDRSPAVPLPGALSPASVRARIRGQQLQSVPVLDLASLRAANVPTLVSLVNTAGEPRTVLVRRIDGETAWLEGLDGARPVRIPVDEIEQRWAGIGTAAFIDYERLPDDFSAGAKTPGVVWLQRALERLGLETSADAGAYGEATRAALRAFQRQSALPESGALDSLTQLRLYASLPEYATPVLSDAATATPDSP